MGQNGSRNLLRLFWLLALAAGPAAVVAQDVATVSTWSGYRSTSDVSLPFAQVAQSASVRIQSVFIRSDEGALTALTVAVTAAEPVVRDTALLDGNARLMQVETCRRQGLAVCPILTVEGSGSGFIDNGNTLYSCRHVVGDWPLAASLLNHVPIGSVLPAMIVRDLRGNLLYNSAYSSSPLHFDLLNEDPRLDDEAILRYRALAGRHLPRSGIAYAQTLPYLLRASDFVGMRSEGDLIAPVPLVPDQRISAGDVYYLSGYPAHTDLLPARYDGTPDALLVSSVLEATSYQPSVPLLVARGLQRPGGSGGIVTNSNGEVIGMSCFADASNAYAFAFDPEAQRRFWATLSSSSFTDVLAPAPIEAASR